ncbi:hypothetical protein K474DRAFT_1590167, partial [Panus rudis PR-1116 ss-1]
VDRNAAEEGKNEPKERWRRALFLLGRLEDGNQMLAQTGDEHAEAARKHLETQHWLEMIDGKHRYGSNCLNYLVQIDSEGRLRWARNGRLVDTTAGRWKDAGGGKGIVPLDHPEPSALQQRTSFASASSSGSSGNHASISEEEADAAIHYYAGKNLSKNPIKRILWKNFTLKGLLDKLLRKTIKRNTWIYVSDKNFNIFIGIKCKRPNSYFISALWTLQHFRQFLKILEERGVDMSKVEISKAEAALWG